MTRVSSTQVFRAGDNTITANAQAEFTVFITVDGAITTGDLGQSAKNIHGLRIQIRITDDEITLANTENHGYWLLLISPVNDAVPAYNTSNINLQLNNPQIWAMGKWSCQRNSMGVIDVQLKTSRNVGTQYIGRLIIHNSAVSDSTVRAGHLTSFWFNTL